MIVSPIIKYRTLAIAKALAPVDTGNLRHNAIHLKRVKPNSWSINYSDKQAHYIEFVEEGTQNQKPQFFIKGSVGAIIRYLVSEFDGENPNTSKFLKQALDTSKNTWKREMVNMRSKFLYSERKKLEKGE